MTPDKLIRPEILALKAYHVAEADGMVKLDAMENPYPLPAQMRRKQIRKFPGFLGAANGHDRTPALIRL